VAVETRSRFSDGCNRPIAILTGLKKPKNTKSTINLLTINYQLSTINYQRPMSALSRVWHNKTPSLRWKLTAGIAGVLVVGFSSVTLGISYRLQKLLITTHKQNVAYILGRFPQDVEHYSEMKSAIAGVQPAIDRLGVENVWLWVNRPDGTTIAQSMALRGRSDTMGLQLMQMPPTGLTAQQQTLGDRYFLVCSAPLSVKGMRLGEIFVAQDITNDRQLFVGTLWMLSLASGIAIALMTLAIAIYVHRSLQPLQQLSQSIASISSENLDRVQMPLDRAPAEVQSLAQTYNLMLGRLSASWEQQNQFVGNVSHELRTPLTLVSGYLQSTLRRGTNLTDAQREALSIAAEETDRAVNLLQDLLDLARADRGYLFFHLEPVQINTVAAEVVDMARRYSDRPIEFQQTGPAISAQADRQRLKQVLLNLIDNAVKYSEPGQPVTVNVDGNPQEAKIQVSDRGVGIAAEHQPRIFDRFYRCDEDRSRSKGGTGLGLSIVKTLVEGMGGRVSVRSQPGEGSIFTVYLRRFVPTSAELPNLRN
jgi:heavy metal sensor kinase